MGKPRSTLPGARNTKVGKKAPAKAAGRKALEALRDPDPEVINAAPGYVRAKDALASGVKQHGKEISDRIRAVVALQIAKFSGPEIEAMLGLTPHAVEKLNDQMRPEMRVFTQSHIDLCVIEFQHRKISVLETIMNAAPFTIDYWARRIRDPDLSGKEKKEAAAEIRAWTALVLKTDKVTDAVSKLIAGEMAEAVEEGERMEAKIRNITRAAVERASEPN